MAVQISALPTPPTRQDPTNFNDRADAFLSALPTFQTEANALSVEVNNRADNVEASDLAVMAATNITKWVSGTTYAEGAVVWSPINGLGYRRITASGSGTTDPSSDSTNYRQVNGTGNVSTDINGNLGLGVTPSAWGPSSAMQFGSNVGNAHAVGKYGVSLNAYYDGSAYKAAYTGGASLYQMMATPTTGGGHAWYTAPAVAANSSLTLTQAMTLDAAGNLGVGTSSPTYKLHVVGSGGGGVAEIRAENTSAASGSFPIIRVKTPSATNGGALFATNAAEINYPASATLLYNFDNQPLVFGTNNTERARIDSSGNLFVGTTIAIQSGYKVHIFPSASSGGGIVWKNFDTAASNPFAAFFNSAGTLIGSINCSNTATSFITSSDYRLKHNVAPMQGALARVKQLKPCTYKWNADGSDGEGFIAHELAEVCPQAVTGEKDAVDADGKPVYQGIDTSFLVATLTAAIQEQQAIITELRSRIEALEAK